MTASRDDFPKRVVVTVAQRAGYLCSNPDCRRPTSGPHSQVDRALVTGQAAHLCAASAGGPRFDPDQSPEERKSIANAIWLCGDCNKRIDTDWAAWPLEKLKKMKDEHERWIAAQEMIPSLPEISLATRGGLRLSQALSVISGEMLAELREQEMTIRNPNRVQLHNFKLNMVLPEAILTYGEVNHNAGTHLAANRTESSWIVESTGDAKVVEGQKRPTTRHTLQIPMIGPQELISIAFFTIDPHYFVIVDPPNPDFGPGVDLDALFPENHIRFFLEGSYQFLLRGEYVTTELFVPMRYGYKSREVASLPVQTSSEPWDVARSVEFPGLEIHG
jgi:hypothetical protein